MDERDDEDLDTDLDDLEEEDEDEDEEDVDAEIWDISRDLAGAVNLVGRLSLLGLMRERGASPGLRHFAQTFGIRLKDRNMSTAKLIRRISRELDSAVSPIHAAAAAALRDESGEQDFAAAFARFGLQTSTEIGIAILAGLSLSVVNSNPTEALEALQARVHGEVSPAEAAMAATAFRLVDRYLAESGIVESAVAAERAHNMERQRDELHEEVKRLRRLTQVQKAELTSLRRQKARPTPAPTAPAGSERDELRALRRENHDLRKQVEALEGALHPKAPAEPERPGAVPAPAGLVAAEPKAPPDASVVRGKSVLVVGGDSKQDVYREIVENLGGEFSFMPAGYGKPIDRSDVAPFDAVIFVATQLGHKIFYRVKDHAKALGIPFRIVTFKGNEAFAAALAECLAGDRQRTGA